jgi:hypothetical protein
MPEFSQREWETITNASVRRVGLGPEIYTFKKAAAVVPLSFHALEWMNTRL